MNNQDTEITKFQNMPTNLIGCSQTCQDFFKIALENSYFYEEEVTPYLQKSKHYMTSYIRGILKKSLEGGVLDIQEMKELDISSQNLQKPGVPLPDLIKYCSGINWATIETFQVLNMKFNDWYKSFIHTEQTHKLRLSHSAISSIENKIRTYWQHQRSTCHTESAADVLFSSAIQTGFHDFEELKIQFAIFSKANRTLKFAEVFFKFSELQINRLVSNDDQEADFKLFKSFIRHQHNLRAQRFKKKQENLEEQKDLNCFEEVKEQSDSCFYNYIQYGYRLYNSKSQGLSAFDSVRETKKFQKWLQENLKANTKVNINHIEHDYDSDQEQTNFGIQILTKDLKEAVDFFVQDDPLLVVRNINIPLHNFHL